MTESTDRHAQPLNRRYNAARLSDRAIDELIGLSRGLIADGVVNHDEAQFLGRWIDRNRHIRDEWPAKVLYSRLSEMLTDGILDADEQRELLGLLSDITGEGESVQYQAQSLSTQLPLTDPPPDIWVDGAEFCLTGRFVYGSRKECEAEIMSRGGIAKRSPTKSTHFLVIGHLGSSDWIHSSHGRKIERAVDLADSGSPIQLVSEQHWIDRVISA
jgi:NAD-dependent DNA ligase